MGVVVVVVLKQCMTVAIHSFFLMAGSVIFASKLECGVLAKHTKMGHDQDVTICVLHMMSWFCSLVSQNPR